MVELFFPQHGSMKPRIFQKKRSRRKDLTFCVPAYSDLIYIYSVTFPFLHIYTNQSTRDSAGTHSARRMTDLLSFLSVWVCCSFLQEIEQEAFRHAGQDSLQRKAICCNVAPILFCLELYGSITSMCIHGRLVCKRIKSYLFSRDRGRVVDGFRLTFLGEEASRSRALQTKDFQGKRMMSEEDR